MKLKTRIIAATLICFCTLDAVAQNGVRAQEQASPIKKAERAIREKFPSNRFLTFEYETFSPTNYDSEIHGEDYEKGRIKNLDRFIVSMNYPIYKSRQLAVIPSLRYKYESYRFTGVENNSINYPAIYHGNTLDTHHASASLKTTYISKLLNKPALYTLDLTLDASDKGYERMAASIVGLIILKRDAQTNITVGLVATYDRTSVIPAFPLFSYEYKFKSKWVFDTFFPKYIYVRKPLFNSNGRLSAGTVLEKNRFFGHPKQDGLAGAYNVSRTEIKTGVVYEHSINRHFIFTVKGGMATPLKWNATKKTSSKTIIDYTVNSNMYVNLGFSYNL